MEPIEISIKTLGLFLEIDLNRPDSERGYVATPYISVNPGKRKAYQWDDNKSKTIIGNCLSDLKQMNSYEAHMVKVNKVYLPCQSRLNTLIHKDNSYSKENVISLFKTSEAPRISSKLVESTTISIELNGKTHTLTELDKRMESEENMKDFCSDLKRYYEEYKPGIEFQRTKNVYLDCMFLIHRLTDIRISLPMEDDNDVTTCVFGMVCAYAGFSVSQEGTLLYPSDSNSFSFKEIVPTVLLLIGETNLSNSKIHRVPSKPSLTSLYELFHADLANEFKYAKISMPKSSRHISSKDELIAESGKVMRETSWIIMKNTAEIWRQRIHVFEHLYCYDLYESLWIKMNASLKFETAKRKAIEKQVVHPFCLDDLRIKPRLLGCGPYGSEDDGKNDLYGNIMNQLIRIQRISTSHDFSLIKNESEHSKFIQNTLKSEKNPGSLIFDLKKKRLDKLEAKSIQSTALLKFRTLFYINKMSVDVLKDILFKKQEKDETLHADGCLVYDWDCEGCLLSVIQSVLDIYDLLSSTFENIITKSVFEYYKLDTSLNQNQQDESESIFDNEIYDSHTTKSKKRKRQEENLANTNKISKFKRAVFVIKKKLDYYLSSCVIELCFRSPNRIAIPEKYDSKYDVCGKHTEYRINGYIVKCLQNISNLYLSDETIEEEKIEGYFWQALLETNPINTKETLLDCIDLVLQYGQRLEDKNNEKRIEEDKMKKEKKDRESMRKKTDSNGSDKFDYENGSSFKSDASTTNENNSDLGSAKENHNETESLTSMNGPSDDVITRIEIPESVSLQDHTCVYHRIDHVLKFSEAYFGKDDSFSHKLKDLLDVMSINQTRRVCIVIEPEENNSSDDESAIEIGSVSEDVNDSNKSSLIPQSKTSENGTVIEIGGSTTNHIPVSSPLTSSGFSGKPVRSKFCLDNKASLSKDFASEAPDPSTGSEGKIEIKNKHETTPNEKTAVTNASTASERKSEIKSQHSNKKKHGTTPTSINTGSTKIPSNTQKFSFF